MSDVSDFLRQSRMSAYPLASFERVGDSVTGTINGKPRVINHTEYGLALLIDLANPDLPQGGVTLWVKQGQMAAAIDEASNGVIEEGGTLTVVLSSTRNTGKPSPLKEYKASYQPPRAKVDVGSIFGQQS